MLLAHITPNLPAFKHAKRPKQTISIRIKKPSRLTAQQHRAALQCQIESFLAALPEQPETITRKAVIEHGIAPSNEPFSSFDKAALFTQSNSSAFPTPLGLSEFAKQQRDNHSNEDDWSESENSEGEFELFHSPLPRDESALVDFSCLQPGCKIGTFYVKVSDMTAAMQGSNDLEAFNCPSCNPKQDCSDLDNIQGGFVEQQKGPSERDGQIQFQYPMPGSWLFDD